MNDQFSMKANELLKKVYPHLASDWQAITIEAHFGSDPDVFIQYTDNNDEEFDLPDIDGMPELVEQLIAAHNPNEPNELLEANISISSDGNVDVDVQYHNPTAKKAS